METSTNEKSTVQPCSKQTGRAEKILSVELREQIAVSQFEIIWQLRDALIIFSALFPAPLPDLLLYASTPPQPLRLFHILRRYAAALFDCENRHYSDPGGASRRREDLACRIESMILEHVLGFESSIRHIRFHAGVGEMKTAIREGLATHIRDLRQASSSDPAEERLATSSARNHSGTPMPASKVQAVIPSNNARAYIGAPADENIQSRRAKVDAFIERARHKTGRRITRTMIWKAAGYKNRTEFERWQRGDARTTAAAHRNIMRVLSGNVENIFPAYRKLSQH